MSKRYFIRVFSMDEEGVKPVWESALTRKLKTRVGNLEGLAEELDRMGMDVYEALGVKRKGDEEEGKEKT